jgi:hypothetical protein
MNQSGANQSRQAEGAYSELLFGIEEITDKLIDAARRHDVGSLDRLLESRQLIIDEMSSSYGHYTIDSTELKAQQARVMEKQAECERLMVEGLTKCRSDLINMRRHRSLRSMYKKPIHPGLPPRFLDKRL